MFRFDTPILVAVVIGVSVSVAPRPVSGRQGSTPRQLVVSVRVLDKKGSLLTDLAPAEFEVKENGQSRTILHAELDRRPLSVALVLDSNGSLSTAFNQNVVPAAIAVIKALPEGTIVDVWTTGDRPTHVATAQSDMAAVEAAINGIAATGMNALPDTIEEASHALPAGEERRTAVITLTSGSAVTRDIEEAVKGTSMRPTFVSLEMVIGEQDARVESELTYLAEHTAGRHETVLSAGALVTKAPVLVDQLNAVYRVAWQPVSDPHATKFEFRTNRKGAKVVSSQRLSTTW